MVMKHISWFSGRALTGVVGTALAMMIGGCATTPIPLATETPTLPALEQNLTRQADLYGTLAARQTMRAIASPTPIFTPIPPTPTITLTPNSECSA
jgi:hypothetical protein